jgi:hypothetical protein
MTIISTEFASSEDVQCDIDAVGSAIDDLISVLEQKFASAGLDGEQVQP